PFRKYFVKDMHGKFPFPEATATTEILITGEKGGKQAGLLIASGAIGGIYDFMFSSLRLWEEVFTSRVIPFGAELAEKSKMLFQLNVSSMIFGFGYLVGLKFSTIIAVGSLLSWFVFIPLINSIGETVAGPDGVNLFAGMSPEEIFNTYVRPIGIGAIAMAGIIGILKSSKVIGSAFSLAVKGIFGKGESEGDVPRTQKDIKMTFIIMLSILTIIAIFVYLLMGFEMTVTQTVIALLTVVIIAFLFTTVAANAIAIVGSNPVSGMTLMTLILSSFVLVQAGLTGTVGMTSALIIGGIVCTALSMAGGFITDLKIGYWIGSTPIKQQSWKFLGTLVSAATVGAVIFILNEAYGFVPGPNNPDPLVAPQANAMAAVIEPLMSPGAQVNWMLYIVGAIIALLLNAINISPLAFALGMYLPLHLNTPLLVGGVLSHFVKTSSKDKALVDLRNQKGTLMASGFIAGAAIFGVVGALLRFFGLDLNMNIWGPGSHGAEILAIVMFGGLVGYAATMIFRTKPGEKL
ncbi:MAG: OPT family oligopeptide transporter, partial [Candidatus Kapaibacterium sp.]